MANRARGEVDVELAGERITLALGLRVLAELEDAFEVDSFEDALNKIGGDKVSASALLKFALAVLRGNRLLTPERTLAVEAMTPEGVFNFIAPMFDRSGIKAAEATPAAPEGANSPLGVPSAGGNGSQSASGI